MAVGREERRCEPRATAAAGAPLCLAQHNRHGNITRIFFSLREQSAHNPPKQRWNNCLFALRGLSRRGDGCRRARRTWKQSFNWIVKMTPPTPPKPPAPLSPPLPPNQVQDVKWREENPGAHIYFPSYFHFSFATYSQ